MNPTLDTTKKLEALNLSTMNATLRDWGFNDFRDFKDLGLRVLGFWVLGFRALGFRV